MGNRSQMKWLALALAPMGILLFLGGPGADARRLEKEIWDLGHVPLFAGLVLLTLGAPVLRLRSRLTLAVTSILLSLLLGLAIEWLQLFVGRTFEAKDLFSDLLGGCLGLLIHMRKRASVSRYRAGYSMGMVAMILIALWPSGTAVADAFILRHTFPVLADFETPFELSRWDTNRTELAMVSEPARHGEKSLRVTMLPGRYPDITLYELKPDWRGFKKLSFSLYSTLNHALPMELKIYDRTHLQRGYRYSDRFNRELEIKPGWNDIEVRIADIRDAPQDRQMEMQNIFHFSLFVEELDDPAILYFDSLRLSAD